MVSRRNIFFAAIVNEVFEPCVIAFRPKPMSLGEVLLHQNSGNAFVSTEINELLKSEYKIGNKFLEPMLDMMKKSIKYFVFEMNDGVMFNYYLNPHDFFIKYPEGYNGSMITKIYPNNIFFENKLITYNETYLNKVFFYTKQNYRFCFL